MKGTHFHCGCGHEGSNGHHKGVLLSKRVMEIGRKYGHDMDLMDLGGGFPAGELSEKLVNSLLLTKDDPLGYKIIAEPGRHFAENTFHLLDRVIGKHFKNNQNGFFINDSMYMNLIGVKIDDVDLNAKNEVYSACKGKSL